MTALGAVVSGWAILFGLQYLPQYTLLQDYQAVFWGYGIEALLMALVFLCLSKRIEHAHMHGSSSTQGVREPLIAGGDQEAMAPPPERLILGLKPKSFATVVKLSALFATDSFAGGLVTGTLLAYYFQVCAPAWWGLCACAHSFQVRVVGHTPTASRGGGGVVHG